MRPLRYSIGVVVGLVALGAGASCNSPRRVLDRGTDRARRALKARAGVEMPFAYMISYGAVDIDPKYATVWTMLGGRAEELLSPYVGFRDGAPEPEASTPDGFRPVRLDPVALNIVKEMRDVIAAEFDRAGWRGVVPWVGFEAESRVDRAGGAYFYFK
jgi:hypothetical protein